MEKPKPPDEAEEFPQLESYIPLSQKLLKSSIWLTADEKTLRVWIVMLVEAWQPRSRGQVRMSVAGLAHTARVSVEDCKAALDILMAPDTESRNPTDGGRRIAPLDPSNPYAVGWKILTWPHFYEDFRRANNAAAAKRYRRKKDGATDDASENVIVHHQASSHRHPDPDPDPDPDPEQKKEPPLIPRKRGTTEDGFSEWWKTYPKKVGRGPALEAWKKLSPEERALALEAAKRFAEAWDGAPEENRRYQLGPAPFLNQKRWEDDPAEWLRIAFRDAPDALKRRQKEAGDLEHRRRMERLFGAAEKENEP